QLVEHDVTEQRRKRSSLWNALVGAYHHAIGQHHLGFEHPAYQYDQRLVVHALCKPRHEPLVANSVEEILQIQVHHVLVPVLQILFRFGNRRLAASSRSETVATRMERRLVHRFEDQTYGFGHHPIDNVRNSEPSLTASRLRNPHPPDISRLEGPFEQRFGELRHKLVEVRAHLFDALVVWARSPTVRGHVLKRFLQPCADYIHQRGRGRRVFVLRLWHHGRCSGG